MRNFLLSFSILALIAACSSSKTSSPEAMKTAQEIREKIQAHDFVVEVHTAQPMRGRSVHLTHGYNLQIRNDSVLAYLPFYGVAHSAPYGREGGIQLSEAMKEYSLKEQKDGWDIRFKANARYYHYDILIHIYNDGNSTIYVGSYERDPIRFIGRMQMPSPPTTLQTPGY